MPSHCSLAARFTSASTCAVRVAGSARIAAMPPASKASTTDGTTGTPAARSSSTIAGGIGEPSLVETLSRVGSLEPDSPAWYQNGDTASMDAWLAVNGVVSGAQSPTQYGNQPATGRPGGS